MRFSRQVWTFCFILLFCGGNQGRSELKQVDFRGCTFTIYEVDPESESIRLFHKHEGEHIAELTNLARILEEQGDSLLFSMNAGIYEPGYIPTGLHIQKGVKISPLNLADGKGNFFLKPNGVFFRSAQGYQILDASEFPLKQEDIMMATQSGPLLLSKGKIHPKFTPDSRSKKIRNAVGVDSNGNPILVFTHDPVNFYTLSLFFRDQLECQDALYLDGSISQIWTPGSRPRQKEDFAGMLGVVAE
ncbi:MAG: phosphodiester glycosidase family protein [Verrucomicrobiota bacterium]